MRRFALQVDVEPEADQGRSGGERSPVAGTAEYEAGKPGRRGSRLGAVRWAHARPCPSPRAPVSRVRRPAPRGAVRKGSEMNSRRHTDVQRSPFTLEGLKWVKTMYNQYL